MIRIIGTGKFVPHSVLTNFDLEKIVDTSDEWIVKRTGIKQRQVATTESVADMAIEAAKQAIQNANINAKDIDLIVCSTVGGDFVVPSVSCLVAGALDLNVPAYDLNAACSGFIFALDNVAAYIQSGKAKTVLLIGADKMSRITDFEDRNTCVLFGDGASAVVVQKGEQLRAINLTTMGNHTLMNIPAPEGNAPYTIKKGSKPYLYMNGPEVYKFAVVALEKEVRKVVQQAGFELSQVKWLIPHQANFRIIETASKALGIPLENVLSNISNCGNTVTACIPTMLHDALQQNKIKQGDIVVMCAFGGGLTTGAAVLVF